MNDPAPKGTARIAVDVGGTTLKGAVFDSSGRALVRESATTFGTTGDPLLELRRLLRRLERRVHGETLGVVAGIGVATAGRIDPRAGRVQFAANLGWRDLALGDLLRHEFGVPVHVEHDARAGALAERCSPSFDGAGADDFIFVPIGTGVSAAVFASGRLVRGAGGSAGEFGHLPVVRDGDRCTCGQRGCVEAYASAASVLARYRRLGGHICQSTPELVANLHVDTVARRVWNDLVHTLTLGLSALTAVLDPSEIVIGGGLANAGPKLLDPLRQAFDRDLTWRPRPPIKLSSIGADAGLIGAALLVDPKRAPADFTANAAASLRAHRA